MNRRRDRVDSIGHGGHVFGCLHAGNTRPRASKTTAVLPLRASLIRLSRLAITLGCLLGGGCEVLDAGPDARSPADAFFVVESATDIANQLLDAQQPADASLVTDASPPLCQPPDLLPEADADGGPSSLFTETQRLVGYGAVRVGDFNGDGWRDLVTDSQGVLSVLTGRGDGTFNPAIRSIPGTAQWCADLNGDRRLDVVGADGNAHLGRGDGTFVKGFMLPTHIRDCGDLNGDGVADVVTSLSGFGALPSMVSAYLGDGKGGYSLTYTQTGYQVLVNREDGVDRSLLDFDGDGQLDLRLMSDAVFALGFNDAIAKGHGDGTFDMPMGFMTEPDDGFLYQYYVATAHFESPARLSYLAYRHTVAAVPDQSGAYVARFLDGAYSPTLGLDPRWYLAVGDFDGDGLSDLGMQGEIYWNAGTGNFKAGLVEPALEQLHSYQAIDLDRDGRDDLVRGESYFNCAGTYLRNYTILMRR